MNRLIPSDHFSPYSFILLFILFYQITRLLAGKPAIRIDLNKQAKYIVSELSTVIYLIKLNYG